MENLSAFPRRLRNTISVIGNSFFPLYLITGKEASAIFELGSATVAHNAFKQLELLNIIPDYLIVSHPHADHLTALPMFAEHFPHAKIIIGKGAQRFATERQEVGIFRREDEYVLSFLRDRGIATNSIPKDNDMDFSICQVAGDNEIIDLGEVSIQILAVKGHSPGNIIAYVEQEDTLLVSDCLGCPFDRTKTFFPLFFTGFEKYMSTIKIIASMGVAFIGLGHSMVARKDNISRMIATAQNCAESLREFAILHRSNTLNAVNLLASSYYKEELLLYSAENIRECCAILIKRSLES
ncbi:MAG: MBL fold metallo-hydrolase [Deltaproteobacteria bacterium]|nr:MBL fold metallo-hydrolase [Deltaproteobacteria bacterium]